MTNAGVRLGDVDKAQQLTSGEHAMREDLREGPVTIGSTTREYLGREVLLDTSPGERDGDSARMSPISSHHKSCDGGNICVCTFGTIHKLPRRRGNRNRKRRDSGSGGYVLNDHRCDARV